MNRGDVLASLGRLQAELDEFWRLLGEERPVTVQPDSLGVMCEQCGRYVDLEDVGLWWKPAGVGIDHHGNLGEPGAPITIVAAVAYCRECRR